ncbi:hypothetical protein ACOSQ2_020988 [Xanthoceras sorbifolium]
MGMQLIMLYIVVMGMLGGQSADAFLKRFRLCTTNCAIDCMCIHPIVVTSYCPAVCAAKCAKCIFKECDIIQVPPPPYNCSGPSQNWSPDEDAAYLCTLGCAASSVYSNYSSTHNPNETEARVTSCSKTCTKKCVSSVTSKKLV